MLPAPFQGHPLQKRTEVQWDMRAWLHADGGANESMSPQLGIRRSSEPTPDNFFVARVERSGTRDIRERMWHSARLPGFRRATRGSIRATLTMPPRHPHAAAAAAGSADCASVFCQAGNARKLAYQRLISG